MTNLYEYEILVKDVFYRGWNILEYIEAHPDMSELDQAAIKATIMDALVTKNLIDPNKQSLCLNPKDKKEKWCVVSNLDYYNYEIHPNVCGIPLWMKEEYRKKSIKTSGGIPVSMFLARPAGKPHYCVYDPNTAASSIFKEATFYSANYDSPTRGIRVDDRPFVEVEINSELYLIDILTKRIFKSRWFIEKFNLEIISKSSTNEMNKTQIEYYQERLEDLLNLADFIESYQLFCKFNNPNMAEFKYEFEKSKEYFPEEWDRYVILEQERRLFFENEDSNISELFLNRIRKEGK